MIPLLQNKLHKWTLTELCLSELKEFVTEQKKKGVDTITEKLRIYLLSLFYSDEKKRKNYSSLFSSDEIGIRKKLLKLEFERMKESMKKNNYQSLVDYVVDEAKNSDFYLTEVLLEFLDRFDLSKEYLNKLFEQAIEVAKTNLIWVEYVIPAFINWVQLDKNLVKEKVNLLFIEIIKEIKQDLYKLKHIVPLVETNQIDNSLLKKELKWIITQINTSRLVMDFNVKRFLSDVIYTLPLEDYIEILEEKWLFEILWKEEYTRLVSFLEKGKRSEFLKKHSNIDFDKEILETANKLDNLKEISPSIWLLHVMYQKG